MSVFLNGLFDAAEKQEEQTEKANSSGPATRHSTSAPKT